MPYSSPGPFLGAQAATSYQVNNSLRFRRSAVGNLTRTFGTPTTQNTFSYSCWTKRGLLSTLQIFFGYSNLNSVYFTATDTIALTNGSTTLQSTAVYRDPSAWYHILYTQSGTTANIYVNGTLAVTGTCSVSFNTASVAHCIGSYSPASASYDGYIAEIYFIDGQVKAVSDFTSIDTTTGVRVAAKYTGTYGNNGFYLPFSDTSALTTSSNAGIGKDFSGNSNYWTTNNISITSGTTYDAMIDAPNIYASSATQGVGNYCTYSPLQNFGLDGSAFLLKDANLTLRVITNSGYRNCSATFSPEGFKGYFELTWSGTPNGYIGFIPISLTPSSSSYTSSYSIIVTGDITQSIRTGCTPAFSTGDILMVAFDFTSGNRNVWFGRNGTWGSNNTGVGVPATGINPVITAANMTSTQQLFFATNTGAGTLDLFANFGQRPFTYTPPSGYKALNTSNLPTPTIANGAQYMAATTYGGNSNSSTVISSTTTNSGNNPLGITFQPDFVWIKNRSNTGGAGFGDHMLYDVVRGALKNLSSNLTDAEGSLASGLSAFNTTGFTPGTSTRTNETGNTYIGWQWKAGGATPVAGTGTGGITNVQYSANPSAGFSIVTYTGSGTAGTVTHGLGVAPSMIIIKARSATGQSWVVYNSNYATPGTSYQYLEQTVAVATSATLFNSTSATSSVFSVGTNSQTNGNGTTFVAYCFAPVAGYSAFGSYTGNGSTDGPFVFTGFRPRWIMIKRTDAANDWVILDTSRNTYNSANSILWADLADAEASGGTTTTIDILSNGFKPRGIGGSINTSSGTYVYAAFCEAPFKFSNAR